MKDSKFQERKIRISYKPMTKEFKVWTNAIQRDAEYIPDISELFLAKENNTVAKFRKSFIQNLNDSHQRRNEQVLSDDDENNIEASINDLLNLELYQIPTLRISQETSEEDVAEIFVRVNSCLLYTSTDLLFNLLGSSQNLLDLFSEEKLDKMISDLRDIYYKYTGEPTRVKDYSLTVGDVTEKVDYFEAVIPADKFGDFAKEILTYIQMCIRDSTEEYSGHFGYTV